MVVIGLILGKWICVRRLLVITIAGSIADLWATVVLMSTAPTCY